MIWNGNEIVLICSFAIKVHSDVTPSYAVMWSIRRGLWWILTNSNLYLLTQNCGKLTVSFEDFFQVFPMRVLRDFIEWVHIVDDFCPSIFPMGVSGFIFHGAIQSRILRFGIPPWLEGSVWRCCWVADWEGQTVNLCEWRWWWICVSEGAPWAQPLRIQRYVDKNLP